MAILVTTSQCPGGQLSDTASRAKRRTGVYTAMRAFGANARLLDQPLTTLRHAGVGLMYAASPSAIRQPFS